MADDLVIGADVALVLWHADVTDLADTLRTHLPDSLAHVEAALDFYRRLLAAGGVLLAADVLTYPTVLDTLGQLGVVAVDTLGTVAALPAAAWAVWSA